MPSVPSVSVSIVSFNTRDLLRECLRSLEERRDEADLEVIVVDNGSTDGSAEMVRDEFPRVRLIEAGENLGYGRANNRALQEARGEFFWVLNSDTTVEPGTIGRMAEWMRAHADCGAVGARLVLPDGSTQASCAGDPGLWAMFMEQMYLDKLLPTNRITGAYAMTYWNYEERRAVPQVCGASLLVRREAWQQVGGFDPRFFMYFEDTDLCLRLREVGWAIWYLPEAPVRHHLGASSERDWRTRARMISSYNHSRLLFFGARRGRGVARALRALFVLGALLRL